MLALWISNRMSPFSSFYDKDFHKNLICPQGITYNPCPEDSGGSVLLKGIISWTLNCVEQNSHLKILICLGKWWAWKGCFLPSNHFRLLKRALAISISNQMSPFWSFYDNTFYKNIICPQGITYNPCPEGCGRVSSSKTYFLPENHLRWAKWLSQNCDWMCLGEWWAWGGASCPPITFDY